MNTIINIVIYLICLFFITSITALTVLLAGEHLHTDLWGTVGLSMIFALGYSWVLLGMIQETIENK